MSRRECCVWAGWAALAAVAWGQSPAGPPLSPPAAGTAEAVAAPIPSVDELLARIDEAQRRAGVRATSPSEREAAADAAIDARRILLRVGSDNDPRYVEWQVSQAEALLGRLARDGADTAVLFALPTPSQRSAVGTASAEAAALLVEAQRLARAQWDRLGGPGSETPGADEAEQLATVRVPFNRGRAEVLLAALEQGAARSDRARAALDAIGRLSLVSVGPECARRVNVAAALLLRAAPPATADIAAAAEDVGWVLTAPEARTGVPSSTRAEAWLALLHIAAAQGRLAAVNAQLDAAAQRSPFRDARGITDTLLAVLVTDTRTRLLWEQGVREGNAATLAEAAELQAELLARTDLTIDADRIAPLVYDKLAALDLPADSSLNKPPRVRLARAIMAARDPQQRTAAIVQLELLAAAPDAGPLAADALWELAVVLLRPEEGDAEVDDGSRLQAARSLLELATRFPEHDRAIESLEASLKHGRALASQADAPPPGSGALYRRALALINERSPDVPQLDLWRYERARLIAADLSAGPGREDELAAGARAVRAIRPDADIAGVPRLDVVRLGERLHGELIERLWADLETARAERRDEEVRRLARDVLVPTARAAVDWAKARSSPLTDRFELDWADALIESGQPQAMGAYLRLLEHASTLPGGTPRVQLGLARAMLLQGRAAEAFAHLRLATDAGDVTTEGGGRARAFWHAWTLMLEMLSTQVDGSERAGLVRAHLRRLEAIDTKLGGEPWRARLERVRQRVG